MVNQSCSTTDSSLSWLPAQSSEAEKFEPNCEKLKSAVPIGAN